MLDEVARHGSWVGGGSVAAVGAALAAALLEKLIHRPVLTHRLRGIRRTLLWLIQRDAATFARVIEATRAQNRTAFVRFLKQATRVQCQVFAHATAVRSICRQAQRAIPARLQSDLRCALAFAVAAQVSARALIHTNLTWLDDRAYTRAVTRRLQHRTTHAR